MIRSTRYYILLMLNLSALELCYASENSNINHTFVNSAGIEFVPIHFENHSPKTLWVSKTEITQKQWSSVTGTNPSQYKREGDFPVENITPLDVYEFCEILKKIDGHEYRMLYHEEWQMIYNMGSREHFDSWTIEDLLENSFKGPRRTAQLPPDCGSLYDFHGNVKEWCILKNQQGFAMNGGSIVGTKDSITNKSGLVITKEVGKFWRSGFVGTRIAFQEESSRKNVAAKDIRISQN